MKKWVILLFLVLLPTQALAKTERECIAQAIYYEARGESLLGQIAVAHVIFNRSKHYKTTICKQVRDLYKYWPKKHTYQSQFLFVADSYKKIPDPTHGSLFFKHRRLGKKWGNKKSYVVTIDNHHFFKEKHS